MKNEIKVTSDLANKKWFSTEDACAYTTFGADALREAREMRKLAYYRKERKIIFKREDLDAWVETHEYHPINGRVQNPNKK